MKSLFAVFTLFMIVTLSAVVYAGSAGGTAPSVGKVNVDLTVPKKASSSCVDLARGRATSANLNVASTTMINWTAKDTVTAASAGTDAVVKRSFDANTAYIPSSGEKNLPIESAVTNVKFARYSGATTITICSEKN